MFNTYLRVRPQRLPSVPALSRTYALTKGAGRQVEQVDQRIEVMKRALYPPTADGKRPDVSPTGVHRSDVEVVLHHVVPSAEAHETITRAWQLHTRSLREAQEESLRRRFECMKEAMEELERVDKGLYRKALSKPNVRKMSPEEKEKVKGLKGLEKRALEARIEGLFPRELRVPTETPSRDGWNHDWKAAK